MFLVSIGWLTSSSSAARPKFSFSARAITDSMYFVLLRAIVPPPPFRWAVVDGKLQNVGFETRQVINRSVVE
jgi:hypothetical protein